MLKYQQEYKYYYCWFEIQSNYSGTANPPSFTRGLGYPGTDVLGAFPFKFPRSSIAISISSRLALLLVLVTAGLCGWYPYQIVVR